MKKLKIILLICFSLCCLLPVACNPVSTETVYTVTVDGKTQLVLQNERVPLPDCSDTQEQIFVGWLCNGQEFSPDTAITQDCAITSVWRDRETYSVSFDGTEIEAKEGLPVQPPVDPQLEGQRFVGWVEGVTPFDPTEPIFSDRVFTSMWEPIDQAPDYTKITFTDLGTVGGVNSVAWRGGVARSETAVHFAFRSETVADAYACIGIFLSVGQVTSPARNAGTVLIDAYVSGEIIVHHYPSGTKTFLIEGEDVLANGIRTQCNHTADGTEFFVTVPYEMFGGISEALTFDATDVLGISMTAADSSTGKFDVWSREDLPGYSANAEVNRSNLFDYLRISSAATLFEANNNNADTFLSGCLDAVGAQIEVGGKTAVTDADGNWSVSLLRGAESSYTISVTHPAYQRAEKTVTLTDAVRYDVPIAMTTAYRSIEGVVRDYASGDAVSGATVSWNKASVTTDEQGKFILENVPLASTLKVSVSVQTHEDIAAEYTSEELVQDGFSLSLSMIGYATEFTVRGTVLHATGALSGVIVTAGNETAVTDALGKYTIPVTYADQTIGLACEGYSDEILTVTRKQLLDGEDFVFTADDIEMVRDYHEWFTHEATDNVPVEWEVAATRTSEEFRFRLTTPTQLDESVNNGVTVFMHLGNASAGRTEDTMKFYLRATGPIAFAHHPSGTETAIDLTGIASETVSEEGTTVLYVSVPYQSLSAYRSVTAQDDVLVTFTVDYASKYDAWTHDLLGANGVSEVSRFDNNDYMAWRSDNTLLPWTRTLTEEKITSLAAAVNSNIKDVFDNLAEYSVSKGEMKSIKEGAWFFTDREKWQFTNSLPAFMDGRSYTYGAKQGSLATFVPTVTKAGWVILLAATGTSSYDGDGKLNPTLVTDGWTLVLNKFYKGYGTATSDPLNLYIKWCEVGDVLSYGNYHIFVR